MKFIVYKYFEIKAEEKPRGSCTGRVFHTCGICKDLIFLDKSAGELKEFKFFSILNGYLPAGTAKLKQHLLDKHKDKLIECPKCHSCINKPTLRNHQKSLKCQEAARCNLLEDQGLIKATGASIALKQCIIANARTNSNFVNWQDDKACLSAIIDSETEYYNFVKNLGGTFARTDVSFKHKQDPNNLEQRWLTETWWPHEIGNWLNTVWEMMAKSKIYMDDLDRRSEILLQGTQGTKDHRDAIQAVLELETQGG